mmetsp:Transcript_13395/g.32708  ORF Transcript_13395/g.32708 Transcript_13395/m.32708 type:complete len:92 (-) Transcript_13395:52-327(-)
MHNEMYKSLTPKKRKQNNHQARRREKEMTLELDYLLLSRNPVGHLRNQQKQSNRYTPHPDTITSIKKRSIRHSNDQHLWKQSSQQHTYKYI